MAIVSSGSISLVDLNDSKQLQLYIGSNIQKSQIYNSTTGVYTPNWPSTKPVLTPQLYVAGSSANVIASAKTIKWFVDGTELVANTTDYTMAATGVKTLTINTNVLASVTARRYSAEVTYTDPDTLVDIVALSDIEFVKLTAASDGASAITGQLSNESASIATLADGSGGIFTGAATTLSIYEGATDVTGSWTISQARTGVTVTEAASSRTATVTAMSTDTGSVIFTATRSGYATITKTFNLTKNKQGASPTAYWLVVDASAIQKNASNVYNPTSINVSGKSQVGFAAPAGYSGRFIVSDSTDGSTFTARYTSAANEATKNYVPSAGIKAIKVQMFLANGTTTLLDEQVIPIVADGAAGTPGSNGANAVFATVWAPDGTIMKNSAGTLTAKTDVYSGSNPVTGSAYKWYLQDPAATTASGGDSDGGNGWRLLTSGYNLGVTGYTTATITIPAAAIPGLETFKCVVTYNSVKYTDICTFMDVTDPIQVVVVGANIFKNGQGTNSLTAKLYQNQNEIDIAGTGYTYSWSLYDSSNVKVAGFAKTGKTINVLSSEINSKATLYCDVSK